MPALFLAAALMDLPSRPGWHAWLVAAVGVAVLPVIVPLFRGDGSAWGFLVPVWHAIGWAGGSFVLSKSGVRHKAQLGGTGGAERLTLLALLLAAPLSVAVAMIMGSSAFFLYVMPLITVLIQMLVFFGVARMRFYDIEVRVARTGDVAARAAESERLAVVGELAATIAHEVRNPLTGVRSLAQRIAEDDVDAGKRRRYATVILEEVSRVERMVDDLLAVAKRSPRTVWDGRATELAGLFEDLTLLTSTPATQAGISVVTQASGLLAPAPREPLAQALLNLVLNAIRHSPRGGVVRLTAEHAADGLCIKVADTGPGIPPDERDRIFEPFYSGANGTGLGLSVVRALARELGWLIEVGDATGGGAVFVIRIPHAATEAIKH